MTEKMGVALDFLIQEGFAEEAEEFRAACRARADLYAERKALEKGWHAIERARREVGLAAAEVYSSLPSTDPPYREYVWNGTAWVGTSLLLPEPRTP